MIGGGLITLLGVVSFVIGVDMDGKWGHVYRLLGVGLVLTGYGLIVVRAHDHISTGLM